MTPWWRQPSTLLILAAYVLVLVWILAGAHDANGAARVPEVMPRVECGTFGCEPVNGGGR